MDEQNRNLFLAFGLSMLVIVIWYALFPPPAPQPATDTVQPSELLPPPPPWPKARRCRTRWRRPEPSA